jgi:hypothetical protein
MTENNEDVKDAAWIGEHGISVKREEKWGKDDYRWVLEECP